MLSTTDHAITYNEDWRLIANKYRDWNQKPRGENVEAKKEGDGYVATVMESNNVVHSLLASDRLRKKINMSEQVLCFALASDIRTNAGWCQVGRAKLWRMTQS